MIAFLKLFGLPHVRIASYIAVATVVVLCGWCYLKGYNAANAKDMEALNNALSEQLHWERERSSLETRLAVEGAREQARVRAEIIAVRPSGDDCSLPNDCLRWIDDTVSAAQAYRRQSSDSPP